VSQAKGSARGALIVFGVLAVASVPLYLAFARDEWFFLDEWDFLSDRTAGNVGDLLRPHVNHWTTVPIVAWRVLWSVFGLRTYVPYVLLSVLVHVAVAALARVVMRRADVDPWIATAVAGVVLLFGAGAQNVMYAFQITFTGALAFGLAHLLLADHDGAIDRRDWIGLLMGALGLMCSGVAVTMVAVVGLATVVRRGWRIAAFHVVPLAVVYVAWWAKYARSETDVTGDLDSTLGFARRGLTIAFGSLGQVVGVGALIAVVLVAGLLLLRSDWPARRAELTAPLALAVGAVLFFVSTGLGRTSAQRLLDDPGASRYQYVAVVLLAPALAVAIDALSRRSVVAGVVAVALLLVGVPGNIADASDFGSANERITDQTRATILSIGRFPSTGAIAVDLMPDPINAPWVTLGWIRSGVESGRIPALGRAAGPDLLATNRLRLSLVQVATPRRGSCPTLIRPADRRLGRGDHLRIGNGAVSVRALAPSGPVGFPVAYGNVLLGAGPDDHELVARSGPLRVRVTPMRGKHSQLC
jgi:hypothetical protein